MSRTTGIYKTHIVGGEAVRAFVSAPLPPKKPGIVIDGPLTDKHVAAIIAIERLGVASTTVPSLTWFLYGFVRKEAVISSQIEGTQATLEDVARFEATHDADRHDDVEEICNYVAALEYARKEICRPRGLPICSRLLCQVHKRLMKGVRGADKLPGTIRTSQNWLGGTRPDNAFFVPPPPAELPEALDSLIASGVLNERTGRKRDRVYGYQRYLTLLSAGTELEPG